MVDRNSKDYLVIPSVGGLLDCFNTKRNRFSRESICHLVSDIEVNTVFVIAVFSFIYQYCNRKDTCTYVIAVSKLKHYRGQIHSSKGFDIKAELEKLNEIACCWDDLEIDRLADVKVDGRKATIESLYFAELYKAMHYLTKKESGKHSASYTSLVSKEILKERNHSAIEIAIEICKLVERRGNLGEGQTAHIAVQTLISRCPTLSFKIDNASTTSRKNQILRDDFNKALELLKDKTKIYEVFEDLQIIQPDRLAVNVENKIEITHIGRILKNE